MKEGKQGVLRHPSASGVAYTSVSFSNSRTSVSALKSSDRNSGLGMLWLLYYRNVQDPEPRHRPGKRRNLSTPFPRARIFVTHNAKVADHAVLPKTNITQYLR